MSMQFWVFFSFAAFFNAKKKYVCFALLFFLTNIRQKVSLNSASPACFQ